MLRIPRTRVRLINGGFKRNTEVSCGLRWMEEKAHTPTFFTPYFCIEDTVKNTTSWFYVPNLIPAALISTHLDLMSEVFGYKGLHTEIPAIEPDGLPKGNPVEEDHMMDYMETAVTNSFLKRLNQLTFDLSRRNGNPGVYITSLRLTFKNSAQQLRHNLDMSDYFNTKAQEFFYRNGGH